MTSTHDIIQKTREYQIKTTFRPELEPFAHQRIPVQGVLIDIIPGNIKSKGAITLVFASVHVTHADIEIDHAVLFVNKSFINQHRPELYEVYSFTALVKPYLRKKYNQELNRQINAWNYQLCELNDKRFKKEPFKTDKLSKHLRLQANNLAFRNDTPYSYEQLTTELLRRPNDGSREEYIENISKKHQKRIVSQKDTIRTLSRRTKYANE